MIGSLVRGGAETYISRVARAIRPLGVELEICALDRSGSLLAELEEAGIAVRGTQFTFRNKSSNRLTLAPVLVKAVNDLRRIVRGGSYDVVHTYLFLADVVGTAGARLGGCRRIVVSRRALHAWRHGANPAEHALELATNVVAHELIANSRTVLTDVVRYERILPRYRTVIYNGVDVARYRPARPGRSRRLRLVTVGALSARKGQEYAIEALRMARDAGVDARLTLVGSGPDEQMLRLAAEQAGIAGQVAFAGEQADPRPFLNEGDIFLLPSRQEGFSNALLEAMASGLPAIATDVGGNAEALLPAGGRIVPPQDPISLAQAIIELAADRDALQAMGGHNRERAQTEFSLASSVQRLADWYTRGPFADPTGGLRAPPL